MVSAALLRALPACLFSCVALGLQPIHEVEGDPIQQRIEEHSSIAQQAASSDDTGFKSLMSIENFNYMYKYRHAMDPHKNKKLPAGVSVVFGVTTKLDGGVYDWYWRIIQNSWMKQRGVCTLGSPPRKLPNCSVYVTRVVGRFEKFRRKNPDPAGGDLYGMEKHHGWSFKSEDVLHLNQAENMNWGKTFWLFHALARKVTWATHIAKVDLDAYPYVYKLVSFLHSKQGCAPQNQFMGVPFLKKKCDATPDGKGHVKDANDYYKWCPSDHCGDPSLACMEFNAGGMYVLSRSLAENVTRLDFPYAQWKIGAEDSHLGISVRSLMENQKECISLYRAHNAWHHWGQSWVDPDKPDFESPDDPLSVQKAAQAFAWKAERCGPAITKLNDRKGWCKIPGLKPKEAHCCKNK